MSRVLLYDPADETSKRQLWQALKECVKGKFVVTIKKNRAIRSLDANKYYHAILNIIAIDTGYHHDELHEIMKLKFNSKIVDFPKGGSQIVGQSTSDLNTAEFAAYLNRVKHWANEEFDIKIPEAKDIDYMKWMQIQDEYGKAFNG